MNLKDISVIITSKNDGASLGRCLDALGDFGEVIVVDAMSTDDTLQVARSRRAVIFSRPSVSTAAQKNWAIGRARSRWVLVLEPVEVASEDLRLAIERLDVTPACRGYVMRRANHYLGRRMRYCGWRGDGVLRLFDRTRGRFERDDKDDDGGGAKVVLDGGVVAIEGELGWFPYEKIECHLDAIETVSTRRGRCLAEAAGRPPIAGLLLRPPLAFLKRYVVELGLLDGRHGFLFSLISSYGIFLAYAKAWEALWRRRHA